MRRLEKVAKNTYRTSWTTWTDKTKDIRHTTIGQTILDPLSPKDNFPQQIRYHIEIQAIQDHLLNRSISPKRRQHTGQNKMEEYIQLTEEITDNWYQDRVLSFRASE